MRRATVRGMADLAPHFALCLLKTIMAN